MFNSNRVRSTFAKRRTPRPAPISISRSSGIESFTFKFQVLSELVTSVPPPSCSILNSPAPLWTEYSIFGAPQELPNEKSAFNSDSAPPLIAKSPAGIFTDIRTDLASFLSIDSTLCDFKEEWLGHSRAAKVCPRQINARSTSKKTTVPSVVPTGNAAGDSGFRSRCERSQNIPAPAKIRISGQYFPTTGHGSKLGNSRESRTNPPNAISSTGNTIELLLTPRSCAISDLSTNNYANPAKMFPAIRAAWSAGIVCLHRRNVNSQLPKSLC